MNILSHDHLTSSIQAVLLFLNLSKQGENVLEEELRSQCLDLLTELTLSHITLIEGVLRLDRIVEKIHSNRYNGRREIPNL